MRSTLLHKYLNVELGLIILALFVNLAVFKQNETKITADGRGYYEYLPATFIYHDLSFTYRDSLETDGTFIRSMDNIFVDYKGRKIDKYFSGLAVLWIPFFTMAHAYATLSSDHIANGFSYPYQLSILLAALFFLYLGLYYLRKTLVLFGIDRKIIILVQFLILFATPLIHYTFYQPSITHVYSFSLINIFIYYLFHFYISKQKTDLYKSAFILGLIVLIRPVNFMVLILIPFLFPNFKELRLFLGSLFKKYWSWILFSFLIAGAIISIQFVIWKVQTGEFLIYSYGDESFNFLDPHFIDFCFSYRKGAFLYTPLLFIALIGGVSTLFLQKQYYRALCAILVFIIIIYVLSSWWYWAYGGSFGSRPLIDYYILFAILLAFFLQYLQNRWVKVLVVIVLLSFVPLNIIQAKQIQYYILQADFMTKEKYWKVFLKTDDSYKGYFLYQKKLKRFKKGKKLHTYTASFTDPLLLNNKDFKELYNIECVEFDSIEFANIIHLNFDGCVTNNNTEILIKVMDPNGKNIHWTKKNTRYFYEENNCDDGELYIIIDPVPPCSKLIISTRAIDDELIVKKLSVTFEKNISF